MLDTNATNSSFQVRLDASNPSQSSSHLAPKKRPAAPIDDSQVGNLLWKLRVERNFPSDSVNWVSLRQQYPLLASCSVDRLEQQWKVLQSVVVLDREDHPLLRDFGAKLIHARPQLTQGLYQQRPRQFHAHVADFNDNLAYQWQGPWRQRDDKDDICSDEWETELSLLQESLQDALDSHKGLQVQGSYLHTDFTVPQPPHVDYPWTVLEQCAHHLWLAFFPLTRQGMVLQLWKPHVATGILVYIPLGKLLLVPSDTIHAGGFRTFPVAAHSPWDEEESSSNSLSMRDGSESSLSCGSTTDSNGEDEYCTGNLRYHLYLATNGVRLPAFAQNVYTIKGNKSRELEQIYHNAPCIADEKPSLLSLLFD